MPFPVSEKGLLLFVGFLYKEKLAPGTIKSYLAAVRYEQISRGLGNPQINLMPQLEYTLKGIKRSSSGATRRRLPITPGILGRLKQVWQRDPAKRDARMLWAASCLCFFGFLRSGEVVCPSERAFDPAIHLGVGDVKVDSHTAPTHIEVRIKASKTDPFRLGVSLHIGKTGEALCPVGAVLSYIAARGCQPGPLFIWKDGRFLTRDGFVTSLRAVLKEAGYAATDYAGHSFRIGAATTAARCGIQDSLIKTLGRWESTAYTRYIRTAPEVLRKVAKTLVKKS